MFNRIYGERRKTRTEILNNCRFLQEHKPMKIGIQQTFARMDRIRMKWREKEREGETLGEHVTRVGVSTEGEFSTQNANGWRARERERTIEWEFIQSLSSQVEIAEKSIHTIFALEWISWWTAVSRHFMECAIGISIKTMMDIMEYGRGAEKTWFFRVFHMTFCIGRRKTLLATHTQYATTYLIVNRHVRLVTESQYLSWFQRFFLWIMRLWLDEGITEFVQTSN